MDNELRFADRPPRPHHERWWGRGLLRVAGLVLAIFVAWIGLFLLTPLGFMAVVAGILLVGRWLGRGRRRELREAARARRRQNMTRAIARGGLETAPQVRLKKPEHRDAEKTALGPRPPRAFGNGFPRGRI